MGRAVVAVAARASGNVDRRAAFLRRLEDTLGTKGVSLLASELGREAAQAVWLLTVQLPNQAVLSVRAAVLAGQDPLDPELGADIALRVIQRAL